MQPNQHGLRDAGRVVEALGVGHVAENRLDPAPVLRVEAVARHEHEARVEAPEAVAPDEQAQAAALPEMQDPDGGLVQLVGVHLDELVARVCFEDLDQRLLVCAGTPPRVSTVFTLRLRIGMSPARLVGRVRVEPEEAALARDLSLGVSFTPT